MDLQASGRGRREERVPLDALIELRSDESDEVLEADGLDLGSGGLSMRASFVPPVGARLECQFRCPPDGDPVRAHGEVVWAEAVGPRSGAFGMRFLELDTKSATAIRRVVDPIEVELPVPELPTVAMMRIDGLGAPIETDVRLAEPDRIVLEQELSFLRLGRGVEVEVPGRGKERGRIASVELRQGPLNVPTLVFGVLLDEVRATKVEPVPPPFSVVVAPARAVVAVALSALEAPISGEQAVVEDARVEDASPYPNLTDTWPERPLFVEATEPAKAKKAVKPGPREADCTRVIVTHDEEHDGARLSEEEHADLLGMTGTPAFVIALRRTWLTLQIFLQARLKPLLEDLRGSASAWLGETLPKAQRLLAQMNAFLAIQLGRLRALSQARAAEKRRTTAPAPRPQQRTAQSVLRDAKRIPDERPAPRNRRVLASALAIVGVGLGIYALAPRSEADRMPVRRRPVSASSTSSALALNGLNTTPAPGQGQANVVSAAAPSAATPVATPAAIIDPTAPAPSAAGRVFGSPEVPNGRVFAIRMSGPVEGVEGDKREDGFTVRVPGRLALDRASPIATSHRAVARAMILNRGDYAELTVDFLPGLRPKYQVAAKDNSIEVTLERL